MEALITGYMLLTMKGGDFTKENWDDLLEETGLSNDPGKTGTYTSFKDMMEKEFLDSWKTGAPMRWMYVMLRSSIENSGPVITNEPPDDTSNDIIEDCVREVGKRCKVIGQLAYADNPDIGSAFGIAYATLFSFDTVKGFNPMVETLQRFPLLPVPSQKID